MLLSAHPAVGRCPGRSVPAPPRRAVPLAASARPCASLASYTGMCSSAALDLGAAESCSAPSGWAALPQNGCQWSAMRHGKRVPRLARPADQRKALLRGLVTKVLKDGNITTTKPKAKAMRKYVDKMIGLAKQGTLHARRQAFAFIYDRKLVKRLFASVPERYANRTGGYTRVETEVYRRRGDNAQMATISLVD